MSVQYGKLCYLILTEHFGEVVGKVAETLQWGPKPLSHIVSSTGLQVPKIKKALCILIQYGFVIFERGKVPWMAEYKLLSEKILLILRYPKYVSLTKAKFGIEAQMLLEEVIKHGNIVGSKAILTVFRRVKEENIEENMTLITLRNNLHNLISNNYLMRCADPSTEEGQEENSVPKLVVMESELYKSPEINMKILTENEAGKSTENPGDNGVYWKVNFDRFHQDMRDEIMINAMRRRFDENAADLIKHLLQLMYLRTEPWSAESNPVPILELKDLITKKSGNSYLIQYFEQYIRIMEEDSSHFISRTGETSSSQVIVNLSKAFYQLSCTAVENIVDQRFGSKASRIFRLISGLKYIEQEQIQQLAMITDKEAKQITYKLLQENFIQMQELRKPTAGSGPNKSFFLFHIDINLVIHMVTGICHKALFNALTRRRLERNDNKRLMEKHEHIEQIIKTMREQGEMDEEQLNELIDDYMAPPERSLLESVEKMIEKLQLAEIQIDDTLFLLQLFSYYQCLSMPKVTTGKK